MTREELQAMTEIEIRQEARFVLWALRRCAEWSPESEAMAADVCQGFEASGFAWHSPECACVSDEEMQVLHALALAADPLARPDPKPSAWWRVVGDEEELARVDLLSRDWLEALKLAGVPFPAPAGLTPSLSRLEGLIGYCPSRGLLN